MMQTTKYIYMFESSYIFTEAIVINVPNNFILTLSIEINWNHTKAQKRHDSFEQIFRYDNNSSSKKT